jgi:hypothetical protein
MPDSDADPRHDPAGAVQAIKLVHQADGVPLSLTDTLEFLAKPFYMGRPAVPQKPTGARGPKHTQTQYELAYHRRRKLLANLHRKLVGLPGLGRKRGFLARPSYVAILRTVLDDKKVPPRLKASEVLHRLARTGHEAPAAKNVRHHLKNLRAGLELGTTPKASK